MYNAFFGFRKAPFDSTPDPEFFFRSKQHDAALSGLLLSVENRMGLISLVGDEGTGKTVVLECLRNSLGPDIPCAFVRDSHISFDRFMETIASDLNLDVRSKSKSPRQVFLALIRLATQQAQSRRTVVLLVDEAHNLPVDVFAEIIHTASLQYDNFKAIQTVFAGRPELQPRLAALTPDRIKQRAILSRSLHPFTASETQEYIEFRLACAGMPQQTVFPRRVLEEIYDRSQGVAPAIHTLCERLLLEAFSATSKVCTKEIRDQAFKKPHRTLSQVIKDASIGVALPRFDASFLAPPPGLEPPPMLTALLRVAVDARRGSLLPGPGSTNERPAYLAASAPPMAFPSGRFTLAEPELALRPNQAMPPSRYTTAAILRPSMRLGPVISSIPVTEFFTRLPKAAGAESRPPELQACRRIPFDPNLRPGSAPTGEPMVAGPFPELFSNVPQPMYPAAGLQPASIIPCSGFPLTPILTIKNHGLASTAVHGDPLAVAFSSIPEPIFPTAALQPASIIPCPGLPFTPIRKFKDDGSACAAAHADPFPQAFSSSPQPMYPTASLQPASVIPCLGVSLTPIRTIKDDTLTRAAVHAGPFPLTFSSIPQPMYPAAGLPAASIVPCSQLLLTPFRANRHALPNSARRFVKTEPASLIPVGRPTAATLDASLQPLLGVLTTMLPLPLTTQPIPPPVEAPISTLSSVPPSLQIRRPRSGLRPADPARPWLVPLSKWIPRIASLKIPAALPPAASAGTQTPPASGRKPPLAFLIPILAALALYGAPPATRAAADVSRLGWQRAQRAVLNRAAVALDEDFRKGLSAWTNRGGSSPSWTSDASGFVRPGALALYHPSLGMVDYQMQFLGMIHKKDLSWVVRATDFENYYAIRLTVLKPGPLPLIGVTRYAVIHGIPQKRVTTPLLMRAQADTIYHVRMDIQGDHFALSIQDQPVDSWSEPRLRHGSIGFFSEKDAESQIASLHVRGHYDMLGRLCAFLLPSGVSNYR